jgi:GNAT superfamily N-acetyltransferase
MNFARWLQENNLPNINDPDWETLNFKYSHDENFYTHNLNFFDKRGPVGYIVWDDDTGETKEIFVAPKYRQQGLGKYIWDEATEFAQQNGYQEPTHSSRRTLLGDKFARSIGGHIPDLDDDVDGWSSR